MLITRDIIRKDIVYKKDEDAFNTISNMTNSFKHMLNDAGAKKGDLVTLGIIYVNTMHVSALMACAELGLRVILLDAPATQESLPYTKLAIHGPADFCIDDEKSTNIYRGLHQKMIETYSKNIIKVSSMIMYEDCDDFKPDYDVSEDDPFIVSSTSGSTRQSRKVEFSHKEVYQISKRAIDIFKFKPDSKVLQTRNLHHASALFTHLFPALMTCKYHYNRAIPDKLAFEADDSSGLNALIQRDKYTHIMVSNEDMLNWLFANARRRYRETLIINMSGFALDNKFIHHCKKYNVEFLSHYGSIDTAIPLLVNHVTKDTKSLENGYLGKTPDNYYHITLNKGQPIIDCELWDEPRKMDDILRFEDGKFFIKSRKETSGRYLMELLRDCPEEINLDLFFQDTKLNMEQLRGHIHEIKKVKKS
jgi:acyl-CoA synthetase (AMP-forming)/AMP-acid ligase II